MGNKCFLNGILSINDIEYIDNKQACSRALFATNNKLNSVCLAMNLMINQLLGPLLKAKIN